MELYLHYERLVDEFKRAPLMLQLTPEQVAQLAAYCGLQVGPGMCARACTLEVMRRAK